MSDAEVEGIIDDYREQIAKLEAEVERLRKIEGAVQAWLRNDHAALTVPNFVWDALGESDE